MDVATCGFADSEHERACSVLPLMSDYSFERLSGQSALMVQQVSHGQLCKGVSDRLVTHNHSTCEQLVWLLFVAAGAHMP
jgi:hypothetical protein